MAALFRLDGSTVTLTLATTWGNGTGVPVLSAESELVRFLVTERSIVRVSELRGDVANNLNRDGVAPACSS